MVNFCCKAAVQSTVGLREALVNQSAKKELIRAFLRLSPSDNLRCLIYHNTGRHIITIVQPCIIFYLKLVLHRISAP